MSVPSSALVSAAVAFLAAIAAALCASLDQLGASLALGGIAAVGIIVLGFVLMGGFNNLLLIFLVFHLLYGLSGPVNALYGEPLAPLFSVPYETGPFLVAFALASAALAVAMVAYAALSGRTGISHRPIAVDPRLMGRLALFFAGFSTLLELTNLIRVGPTVAFEGKAIYQSAVDALTLTAPTYEVSRVAFCLLGLSVAGIRRARAQDPRYADTGYVKACLFLLLPLILLTLLLGRRGPILDWIFIYFVASTWYESRRKVSRAVLTGAVITYLTMGMLFANRATLAYAFLVNDFSTLADHATQPEVIVSGLNPGGNEFGAAYGNFSEYYKYDVDGPQFGRTYVEGAALVVPSFLYPGTKPQPVAYAFRDRFFPGVADEGAIASTAYSSLLEAYVNFRMVGVALVYALVGVVIMWLEDRRRRSASLAWAMIYLLALPSAFVFHRADFGASVISPMFFSFVLIVFAITIQYAFQTLLGPVGAPRLRPVDPAGAPIDAL